MSINTIIFDLDGVLVDTENIHIESLRDAILAHTVIELDEINKLLNIDGKTTKSKLQDIQVKYGLTESQVNEIDTDKQKRVMDRFKTEIYPQHSIIDMFLELKRHKLKLGLASNSRKKNVLYILNALGITGFFKCILTSDDISEPKPSPEIFLMAMERLNSKPEETLILEDSPAGQTAAIASGAKLLKINSIKDANIKSIRDAIDE